MPRRSHAIRPLAEHELASARALARTGLGSHELLESARSSLEQALTSPGAEHRALAALSGDDVVGLIAFGEISGTLGVGRITAVVVRREHRRQGIGLALVDAATTTLAAGGARLIIIEMPDAAEVEHVRHFLIGHAGFREESRIRDYYRDGVSLSFLRLELR